MGTGEKTIVIQILDDKDATSADELDDHILCLEAARGHLEVEWTETLGALNARELHKVFGYPSAIAYLKHRCRMAGGRARRYVSMARLARRFHSTFLSWKHGQSPSTVPGGRADAGQVSRRRARPSGDRR